MDRNIMESWFDMPIGVQISNIGSEVYRAIKWKNKNDMIKSRNFCIKALEFLDFSISDPKNRSRLNELRAAKEELFDHFMNNNFQYDTTDHSLAKYYDSFLYCKAR
jgi:hypothetical protein